MANSGWARQATAATTAVAGGVIGADLFAWLGRSDVPGATRPASADTEVARPAQVVSPRPRLEAIRASALEARVQALEAAREEEEPIRVPDYETSEPPSQREVEERHEERIQAHRSEDLDPVGRGKRRPRSPLTLEETKELTFKSRTSNAAPPHAPSKLNGHHEKPLWLNGGAL